MDRKKAESFILKYIQKIDPSGENKKIYEEFFKGLSNKEFEQLRQDIKDGKSTLTIIAPEGHPKIKLDANRNRKILKELKIDIYQKLTITDGENVFTPDIKYQILELPVRLAAQHIMKNFTVHKNTKVRNTITGQVAGDSKSGELSNMETQILKSIGMDVSLKELLGIRGGDVSASNAFKGMLMKKGKVNQQELKPFMDKTQIGKTLKAYMKAIHIDAGV